MRVRTLKVVMEGVSVWTDDNLRLDKCNFHRARICELTDRPDNIFGLCDNS